MIYLDDQTKNSLPSDVSDHDERDEQMAVEKHWDEESNDAAAQAGERLREFEQDGVPLSDEDWDKEDKEEEMSDQIDAVVDQSLEELADEELSDEE